MRVWAVSYVFAGEDKTLLVESPSDYSANDVEDRLHPAIKGKRPIVEYVGELA